MSPSDLRHLWDHRAILHRLVITQALSGDVVETWAAQTVPAGKNCRPNQTSSGDLSDVGAGEQQTGHKFWFLDRRFADVRERDVLEIVSGQEAGTKHRILSVTRPTHPQALHHFDVTTEVFPDALTPAAA